MQQHKLNWSGIFRAGLGTDTGVPKFTAMQNDCHAHWGNDCHSHWGNDCHSHWGMTATSIGGNGCYMQYEIPPQFQSLNVALQMYHNVSIHVGRVFYDIVV